MLANPAAKLPVRVAEPETVPTGGLFLSDLLSAGVSNVTPKTILRATCTIGTRYRDVALAEVVVPDYFTAVIEYTDGSRYQVEYLLDQKRKTDLIVQKIEDYVHDKHWNLLLVAEGPLSPGATRYCASNGNVDVIRLEHELTGK